MAERQINYRYVTMNYVTDGEAACDYINRLDQILMQKDFGTKTIERMLDSVVESDLNEINSIKKNLQNVLQNINKCNDLKQVFVISKSMANNFMNYGNIIKNFNQIESITFDGIDRDKIVELEDAVNDHIEALRSSIENLTEEYKKFISNSDSAYKSLNSAQKNIVKKILTNTLSSCRSDNVQLCQEGSFLKAILGVAQGIGYGTLYILKKFWAPIVALMGISYLSGISIFDSIGNLISFFDYSVTTIFVAIALFFALCLCLWIYHKFIDYKYTGINKELSQKLDQINANAKNDAPYTSVNKDNISISSSAPNNVVNNTFRGFDNTSSYKPEGVTDNVF